MFFRASEVKRTAIRESKLLEPVEKFLFRILRDKPHALHRWIILGSTHFHCADCYVIKQAYSSPVLNSLRHPKLTATDAFLHFSLKGRWSSIASGSVHITGDNNRMLNSLDLSK